MSDEEFLATGRRPTPTIIARRWEVIDPKPLGEGGQGLAFRVRDQSGALNGEFVLKQAKSTDSQPLQRFRREVEATKKLDHPNVVSIMDYGLPPENTSAFYVMPLYEGGNLWNFVKMYQRNLTLTLDCFLAICEGVRAAHAMGLVHHDLKPANVLMDGKGIPKVSDFGICVDLLDADERFTRTDEWKGPKGFRPPELEGGRLPFEEIMPSTDIYMLGKILWYMAGAQREDEVFTREDFKETHWNLYARTADPRYRYINERILERTVVREPKARFQSVEELVSEVKMVRRLIEGGFEPLAVEGMICKFCGEGTYRPLPVNQLWYGFGVIAPDQTSSPWRGMHCDKCGNMQVFRVDLGANWLR